MNEAEFAEMHANERTHWWFVGKRLLFLRLLRNRLREGGGLDILDIGCGTGATAEAFARYGRVVAADSSPEALGFARSRNLRRMVRASVETPPFRDAVFDLALAFDVLEHVDDDSAAVRGLARTLRPEGCLAIHVPAWPALWGPHDEALGHRRRYTRRSLVSLLEGCGLAIEKLTWASASILPAAVIVRGWAGRGAPTRPAGDATPRGSDRFALPAPLNSAMVGLYRAEATLAATTGLPFGLSLAAICRVRR